jgi:hypothetical protein
MVDPLILGLISTIVLQLFTLSIQLAKSIKKSSCMVSKEGVSFNSEVNKDETKKHQVLNIRLSHHDSNESLNIPLAITKKEESISCKGIAKVAPS